MDKQVRKKILYICRLKYKSSLSLENMKELFVKRFPSSTKFEFVKLHKIYRLKYINNSIEKFYMERYKNIYSNYKNTEKLISYINNKYNLSIKKSTFIAYCNRNHCSKIKRVSPINKKLTIEQELDVIEKYQNGEEIKNLQKEYDFKTHKSIIDILNKYHIEKRTSYETKNNHKTYKDFSMQNIDSNFKAYFLGLLLTDGYVNEKRNMVGIDLCDEDCISFLANNIKCKYSKIESKKYKNRYRIILYSKKLVQELKRLSVVPNKSLTLKKPNLTSEEEKFLPYILRGIIDGDGCVGIYKNIKVVYVCSASEEFINWVIREFSKLDIYMKKYKTHKIFTCRIDTTKNLNDFYFKIYNKPFGMTRKYNLILEGCSETIMKTS